MIQVITLAIVAVLLLVPAADTAYAQIPKSITIDELDPTYSLGDKIIVFGRVMGIVDLSALSIKITRGDTFVVANQLSIAQDGTFATIFNTDGGVWQAGDHRIEVIHTDLTRSTAVFTILDSGTVRTEDIFTVDIGDGETVDIGYAITGGMVNEMEISQDLLSLIVRIQAETGGNLTLDIDREYLDAKSGICSGNDEDFIVLVGGVEVPYKESDGDPTRRTIGIPFEKDESKIQIIGTCAIPEFGALSMVVLAIATAAIVAASRRFAV